MISCCFQPLQPCSSHFSSSSSSPPHPRGLLVCPNQTLSKLPNDKPIEKSLAGAATVAAVWGETAAVQRSCSSLSSRRCQSVVIRTHAELAGAAVTPPLSFFPLSLSNVIFERAHSSRLTMGRARSAEGHRDTGAE